MREFTDKRWKKQQELKAMDSRASPAGIKDAKKAQRQYERQLLARRAAYFRYVNSFRKERGGG